MAHQIAEGAGSAHEPTAAEAAAFIARSLAGLEEIAGAANLAMLAYLLEIARQEAEARAKGPG